MSIAKAVYMALRNRTCTKCEHHEVVMAVEERPPLKSLCRANGRFSAEDTWGTSRCKFEQRSWGPRWEN